MYVGIHIYFLIYDTNSTRLQVVRKRAPILRDINRVGKNL